MRVLISVSAHTYSREYVVLTNVFMRNSFFFFCIAYPFKDVMLLADAEVLEDMMKNLIARYRLACNLPYMQDGLTQVRRKQVRR